MISTKIYNQRLDLKDVDLIYDTKEKSCMKLLKEIYKSKCFKGSYILDIIEIIKSSDTSLSTYHLDVRGDIWVTFTAKIIEYPEDDLISNCKIIRKIEDKVFAKVSHGIVRLLTHDLVRLVKEGDTIPIIVKKSKYMPLRDSISIFAIPFTPSISMNRYVYVLIQPMNPDEIKKMKLYVEHAKKLKEWGTKLKGGSCSRDYIEDLNLYIDSLNISPEDVSELKIKIGKTNTALFLNGVKIGYTTIYQHALDNVLGIPSISVKLAIDAVETNNSTPDSLYLKVDENQRLSWNIINNCFDDESSDDGIIDDENSDDGIIDNESSNESSDDGIIDNESSNESSDDENSDENSDGEVIKDENENIVVGEGEAIKISRRSIDEVVDEVIKEVIKEAKEVVKEVIGVLRLPFVVVVDFIF